MVTKMVLCGRILLVELSVFLFLHKYVLYCLMDQFTVWGLESSEACWAGVLSREDPLGHSHLAS